MNTELPVRKARIRQATRADEAATVEMLLAVGALTAAGHQQVRNRAIGLGTLH